MSAIAIKKVSDLPASERAVLKGWFGQEVPDGAELRISFNEPTLPRLSGPEAAARMAEIHARMNAKRDPSLDAEMEEALEEAMKAVRPSYRPCE